MVKYNVPVASGATSVDVEITVNVPTSPPVPPVPPAPVNDPVGKTITAGVGSIKLGNDVWTVAEISSNNNGIFKNGVYASGAFVTSLTYTQSPKLFEHDTSGYGKWAGNGFEWGKVEGPVSPPVPPTPPVPPVPPSPPVGNDGRSRAGLNAPLRALPSGFSQVWIDEFNGTDVDPTRWTKNTLSGPNSYLNQPRFAPERVKCEGGRLVLDCIRSPDGIIVSGGVTSANKVMYQPVNTYWEARIMYGSNAGGCRSSFWMVPVNFVWPNGELDCVEGGYNGVLTSIHNTGIGVGYSGEGWKSDNLINFNTPAPAGVDLSDTFHDYAIQIDPDAVTWYFDGQKVLRVVKGSNYFAVANWVATRQMLLQHFINPGPVPGNPGRSKIPADFSGDYPANLPPPKAMEVAHVRIARRG